jgi:polyisoprenoid-binding protein YceI
MLANYKIDPAHSSAQFSIRHMMISNVRGGFGSVQGTVAYDSDLKINVEVSLIKA